VRFRVELIALQRKLAETTGVVELPLVGQFSGALEETGRIGPSLPRSFAGSAGRSGCAFTGDSGVKISSSAG